jgi:micrococcal nuclease
MKSYKNTYRFTMLILTWYGLPMKFLRIVFVAAVAIGSCGAIMVHAEVLALCGGGKRVSCVVDGDTFWLDGVKIRVADIDAPERSRPKCAAERALAERATVRFLDMLNAGGFELVGVRADEDRYGRKLRRVMRGPVSLGEVLVAEGLARRWDGARHGWCD